MAEEAVKTEYEGGYKPGDRIGCDYRTDRVDNSQPWLYHSDPRGTVLGWDDPAVAHMTPKLAEESYPGYMKAHAPVMWTFETLGVTTSKIYVERVNSFFRDGQPPEGKDWTKFQGERCW